MRYATGVYAARTRKGRYSMFSVGFHVERTDAWMMCGEFPKSIQQIYEQIMAWHVEQHPKAKKRPFMARSDSKWGFDPRGMRFHPYSAEGIYLYVNSIDDATDVLFKLQLGSNELDESNM
ncbi:hypothetical protein [Paraburkholderia kirstenboschensis]|uniref:Uncharacterized protein n=1 Tax=Paraburkholderia kirstenboschensis TaxID=1245436 RepID=A0ABZ0EMZ8_9BURK|nr:hypothetical protein [Paraburkholderia kirstenboschensis]WOD18558.1 hypothetical protein RW095_38110 [Paraburkholderia kirstenboschensis]